MFWQTKTSKKQRYIEWTNNFNAYLMTLSLCHYYYIRLYSIQKKKKFHVFMQVSRLESFLFNSLSCVYHIMSLLSPFLFVFGLFCFIKFWISDPIWILLKNTTGNFHDHRYKRTHDDNDDYDPNNNNDVCFEILFTQRWIYSNIVEWETKKKKICAKPYKLCCCFVYRKKTTCLSMSMDGSTIPRDEISNRNRLYIIQVLLSGCLCCHLSSY